MIVGLQQKIPMFQIHLDSLLLGFPGPAPILNPNQAYSLEYHVHKFIIRIIITYVYFFSFGHQ